MNQNRLVEMANDIAANLSAYPTRAEAVDVMVQHLQRFWVPEMRAGIVQCLEAGGEGFSALTREAVEKLAAHASPAH